MKGKGKKPFYCLTGFIVPKGYDKNGMEMVGTRGFEPPTPASRTLCSTRLSHVPTSNLINIVRLIVNEMEQRFDLCSYMLFFVLEYLPVFPCSYRLFLF